MRILVLDQFGAPGGAQLCLLDAVQSFRAREWEVHALLPDGPVLHTLESSCATTTDMRSAPLGCGKKTATDVVSFAAGLGGHCSRISAMIRTRDIDVLYVNGPRLMPAAALAHGPTSVIFHAHNVVTQPGAAMLLRAAIRLCRARVIACSRFVAQHLNDAAAGCVTVVPNGVRPFKPLRRDSSRPFTVGMLGRIAPEKGQLDFVRAACTVRDNLPDTRFIMGGETLFTADSDYAATVRSECAAAGIEMRGWVSDVSSFLAAIDILVVPSSASDAAPRVILEAFAARTPVVAFAVGGIPEMIRHATDGILVPRGDAAALAAEIVSLAYRPEFLRHVTLNAAQRFESEFTLERFQQRVCEEVEAAAARRHHRTPLTSAGVSAEA